MLRIMPLGDSVTKGTIPPENPVGYRRKLHTYLTEEGFNVEFVGSLSDGGLRHEGHDSGTIEQIRDDVYDWLVRNPADIVLLHIGTNDIVGWGEDDVKGVEDILNNINRYELDYMKHVTVILARIILRKGHAESVKRFNEAVVRIVHNLVAEGDDVIVADMESALTYEDLLDAEHPNMAGYEKMAKVWCNAIKGVIENV